MSPLKTKLITFNKKDDDDKKKRADIITYDYVFDVYFAQEILI